MQLYTIERRSGKVHPIVHPFCRAHLVFSSVKLEKILIFLSLSFILCEMGGKNLPLNLFPEQNAYLYVMCFTQNPEYNRNQYFYFPHRMKISRFSVYQ